MYTAHLSSTDSCWAVHGEAYSTTSLQSNTSSWCSLLSACTTIEHTHQLTTWLWLLPTSLASSWLEKLANTQCFCGRQQHVFCSQAGYCSKRLAGSPVFLWTTWRPHPWHQSVAEGSPCPLNAAIRGTYGREANSNRLPCCRCRRGFTRPRVHHMHFAHPSTLPLPWPATVLLLEIGHCNHNFISFLFYRFDYYTINLSYDSQDLL